ncbi:unnamed protein product [Cladocopium goreaui]|uniref:Viral histone-like protein n=1 Tax=Cladocopium goreaui TaxID=2562237 RepID=A0A9P1DP73_9DINO|nr:unnamed protein product [Cladocopium goreaui]
MGSLADATEMKKSDIAKILNSLTEIGTEEVKKSGKFTLPGLCMIKTRQKPATKAGKRLMFGKEVMVKAQPAKTVVKASVVAKKVAMKAMKGQKAMTKGGLMGSLADATEMKKSDIAKILNSLTEIGTEEVKKSGKFTLPGLCMIKTRQKPATKAGKRLMFGKEVMVKAQPAKTVVKASVVAALKSQI